MSLPQQHKNNYLRVQKTTIQVTAIQIAQASNTFAETALSE